MGPIRAALLVALIQTPNRFRTKRQLWAYIVLALETRTSGEYCYLEGQLQRFRKVMVIRRLIQDHNHDLKGLPKATASTATALGSLGRCICRRWFQFASKNFFSPDPNRNTGRDGLAASV